MKNFQNKVVVITGAGSGMGRAYAEEFARLGAHLSLCDNNEAGLNETVQGLQLSEQQKIVTYKVDVANKDQVYDFAAKTKEHLGNTHVLINNAGVEGGKNTVFALDESDFERVMSINFYGVLYGCKAFLPQITQNDEGAIVNVSSIFGLIGTPSHADYCASKFAVRGFTESLMVEFEKSPIQIHSLHPGGIKTNISKNIGGSDFSDKYLITPPEDIAKYVVKCIQKKQLKMVFGHGSTKTWLGANLLPLKWLNKLIWNEMKDTFLDKDFSFLPKK